jgi:hypothetical protein
MCWTIILLVILENFRDDRNRLVKEIMQDYLKALSNGEQGSQLSVSPLARVDVQLPAALSLKQEDEATKKAFDKNWTANLPWIERVLSDAVDFARSNEPRAPEHIERVLHAERWKLKTEHESKDLSINFAQAWQSLKNRGWTAEVLTTGKNAGKTKYQYEDKQVSLDSYLHVAVWHSFYLIILGLSQYWTYETVLKAAQHVHKDLAPISR